MQDNTVSHAICLIGLSKNIGQVDLTLLIVSPHVHQCITQKLTIKGINPGIDFADRALIVSGVFLLDNSTHVTGSIIANNTSISRRIINHSRQDRHRCPTFIVRGNELIQSIRIQHWHIAIGNNNGSIETMSTAKQFI